MAKYKDKYRIESSRLPYWDYGSAGCYFVTICTKNRANFFGRVDDVNVELSQIGAVADRCWLEIPRHFPFVELDEYIVMPNHIHGIIIIENTHEKMDNSNHLNESNESNESVETQDFVSLPEIIDLTVETQDFVSLPEKAENAVLHVETPDFASLQPKNRFGPQSMNLASIIRGFKAGVTKFSKPICPTFAWQPRFYDHIIRSERDIEQIREYIRFNPSNWKDDDYFSTKKPPSAKSKR